MRSEIKQLSVTSLEPNPYRKLGTYPWIDSKIKTLQNSFRDKDVGVWEGVIARRHGTKYELAFGHHRVEAAKRSGIKTIPVIVKPLTDEQMLKYMGRENMEDYRTEFLIMLNAWEGAVKFEHSRAQNPKAIDMANLLGWTRLQPEPRTDVRINNTAAACDAAYQLIQGGHLSRGELAGLTVTEVRHIVIRAQSRMEALEKMAKTTKRPKKEVEQAKQHVAKGAKIVADKARKGTVAVKDISTEVEVQAYKAAAASKVKESPLFDSFGKALITTLEKMLNNDAANDKLKEIKKAIPNMSMSSDLDLVENINFQLGKVSDRALRWQKTMIPTSKKVSTLKALTRSKS